MSIYTIYKSQCQGVLLFLMGKVEWTKNLAKNVKKRRKELGMSQQAVAEASKLALTTIARIEQNNMNNPRFDTIEALGKGLKISDSLELLRK